MSDTEFKIGDKVKLAKNADISTVFEREVFTNYEDTFEIVHVSTTSPFLYIRSVTSKSLDETFSALKKDLISLEEHKHTIAVDEFHDWLK